MKMKLAVFVSLLAIIPFQAEAGSCVGKTVDVWVANGHDLTGDGLQDPDPYVVVTIGSDTQKTRIIHGSSNPSWWQRLRFYNADSDVMRIDIWEHDEGLRGDDDHLGTCIEPIVSGGEKYTTLECAARDSGSVRLFYRCY